MFKCFMTWYPFVTTQKALNTIIRVDEGEMVTDLLHAYKLSSRVMSVILKYDSIDVTLSCLGNKSEQKVSKLSEKYKIWIWNQSRYALLLLSLKVVLNLFWSFQFI